MHEVQTDEGIGNFLSTAKPKSDSSAYPSSVSSYLADSFPPRGKLRGALPEGFLWRSLRARVKLGFLARGKTKVKELKP